MSDGTIGRALRTRRAQIGLDQKDAATRIGMSRTTYSSYERDMQRPSVDVLPAIADFLEVSIDDVLALYGASAIAAARASLAHLNSVARTDVDVTVRAPETVNGSENGNEIEPPPLSVSTVTAHKPEEASGAKGKSKKKNKKKKGKWGRVEVPAFSTHI